MYSSLTKSPGENVIAWQVYGQYLNGAPCRIWTQIFDCKDGSFIMRYKVFNTCFNVKIKVKIKGKELPMPYSEIKGMLFLFSPKSLNIIKNCVSRSCLRGRMLLPESINH